MMDDVADFSTTTDSMLHTPVANGLATSSRAARTRSSHSMHAFSPGGHGLDPDRPRPFGANPFTLDEKIKIAHDLSRKLPPDCISSRSGGAAGRVTYLEGWKAIELANEIFGFNGWATQVLDQHIDFMDPGQNPNDPRWSVGIYCTMRITLRDGSFREARKEATTDAIKRTLRLFGNALGNCLNDKDFIRQVSRVPHPPSKPITADDMYSKHSIPPGSAMTLRPYGAPAPAPAPNGPVVTTAPLNGGTGFRSPSSGPSAPPPVPSRGYQPPTTTAYPATATSGPAAAPPALGGYANGAYAAPVAKPFQHRPPPPQGMAGSGPAGAAEGGDGVKRGYPDPAAVDAMNKRMRT
ncbi:DNA repair protein rad52 [Allomyces javanicus]|nr:DNA repair protein rad52 [Allomyces javanicus]